uniref:Uncharacterized protein n=1 Tax=Romanomermis culicivorax TaxID=13658 RepID=A0A915JYG3_ROMCU
MGAEVRHSLGAKVRRGANEHPLFNIEALDAALRKVMYISVQKQNMGSQYNVLTYQGTKTFKASSNSPLTVKIEQISATNDAIEWPHKFSKIRIPQAATHYVQLLEKIPALFQNTLEAHSLQSSPENLFSFVQGALEFNYQRKNGLQIRSNYDFFDHTWKELLVLPTENDRWGSDRQPLVITSRYSSQQRNSPQEDKVALPNDFNTESPDAEVVRFILSDLGIIMQYKIQLPIAERISIVDQLLSMVSTSGNDGQLKADATSIIHNIELDSAFFSRNTDSVGHKHFTNYMLGKLMGYCSGKDVETFTFDYTHENTYKDLVSFIIKEKGRADGVAFHIQECSRDSPKSTITDFRGKPRPEYSKIGITDRILQLYFDFGSPLHPDEPPVSQLSPFQVKKTFAGYTNGIDMTTSYTAEGTFRVIEQHFRDRNLYHLLARNEKFSLPLVQHASNIGLGVQTQSELHALINSYCLEKAGRDVFLAYPVEDPAILGVKLNPGFPIILMKSGLEKTQFQMMDDLRATYMSDYSKYENKRNVYLTVNALTTTDPSTAVTHGEYTNGIYGPFYERCSATNRVRRDNGGDFCRRKNREEEEEAESLIEESNENTNQMKAAEEELRNIVLTRRRVVQHLENVGKLSSAVMHFAMGKNILGALIDGDFEEVAINTGFLAGSIGLGYASQYATLKGARLAVDGSRFLGTTLKLAAPFLARVTSAFVAFDLYKQVISYKDGNKDAIVGVATDSTILAIDVAEVTVEILESLEFISSISSVTGPVGAAIGAIIFVATDIYYAVTSVDKIDSALTLTGYEKFKEGLLAFIHASPETYIQNLMENKQLNNEVANRSATILKSLRNVKIYASPTLIPCSPNLASNFCMSGVMESNDNIANFTNLQTFYTRTWPNPPSKFQTICANANMVKEQARNKSINVEDWLAKVERIVDDYRLSLECYNFEAILDINDKNGNDAFIKIESGNDTVTGFYSRKNIIAFTDGFKQLVGGNLADTFILHDSLNYIHRETVDTDTHVDVQLNNGVSLLLRNLNLQRTILIFKDFNMTIEPNGLVCEMKIPAINDPMEMVQKILDLRHIGASFVVEDGEKRLKISAGHSSMVRNKHNMNASAPQANANILSNDLQFKQSILLSSESMQDVYHIKTLCNSSSNESLHCLRVVTSIYLDEDSEKSNQTLD